MHSKIQRRNEMTQIDDNLDTNESPTPNEGTDRRAMLRKMAIGGAGAAAAAVALGRTVEAGDQAGTQINGNAVELGETNTATLPTIVTTSGTGSGLVAVNTAAAAANATTAAPQGSLAVQSANGPQIVFLPSGATAVSGPTPGTHVAGELYVDKDGTLWFTVPAPTATAPTAVKFVQLAGTTGSGSFHSIVPQRAYDSRITAYTPNGVLAPNQNRVVSVANGHNAAGAVTLADAVPVGATAVEINLTAADPTDKNFLAVAPGDATSTATSLLNWNAGVTQIANSITVKLDASRQIKVFCGDQAGSTQFIVDVFGYYI